MGRRRTGQRVFEAWDPLRLSKRMAAYRIVLLSLAAPPMRFVCARLYRAAVSVTRRGRSRIAHRLLPWGFGFAILFAKRPGGRTMEATGGIILLIVIVGGALVALRYVIRAARRVGNLASTVTEGREDLLRERPGGPVPLHRRHLRPAQGAASQLPAPGRGGGHPGPQGRPRRL